MQAHQHERHGDDEEADADLAQRRHREEAAQQRVDAVAEDWHQHEDEQRVHELDLRGQHDQAETEVLVHQRGLRLQRPGLAVGLLPQRPEEGDEQIDDRETADGLQAIAREYVAQPGHAGGRHDGEFIPAQPEHDGGAEHGDARQAEGVFRTVFFEQDRTGQDRDQRTGVDGEVEPRERTLDQMLVLVGELVADIGRDAGFDAAGAKGDQGQPWNQTSFAGHQGQDRATGAVEQRERDDGAELSPEHVGDDGADQREEIHRRFEQRLPGGRLRLGETQVLHHVDRKNRVDAVVAEAFGKFVGDDVGNAGRHPVVLRLAHFGSRKKERRWAARSGDSKRLFSLPRCGSAAGRNESHARNRQCSGARCGRGCAPGHLAGCETARSCSGVRRDPRNCAGRWRR